MTPGAPTETELDHPEYGPYWWPTDVATQFGQVDVGHGAGVPGRTSPAGAGRQQRFSLVRPQSEHRWALWQKARGQVAANTIFHDALRPSHVLLPVMP